MDSDGVIVDETRKPLDVSNEEVLKWYKDMLTGMEYLVLGVQENGSADGLTMSG